MASPIQLQSSISASFAFNTTSSDLAIPSGSSEISIGDSFSASSGSTISSTSYNDSPSVPATGSASSVPVGRIAGGIVGGLIVMIVVSVVLFRRLQKRSREDCAGRGSDWMEEIHPYPQVPSPAANSRTHKSSGRWKALATPIRSLSLRPSTAQASPALSVSQRPEKPASVEHTQHTENPEPFVISNPAVIPTSQTLPPPIAAHSAQDSDQEVVLIEALQRAVDQLNALRAERCRQSPPSYGESAN
ncbi:hypothetical protein PUNSTDRAFT_136887 [Punctularia strigosozonata HHB-11173 SS5]|uniref:uncharacterized protein n=1 Tax=Punctularia strigosozonata (strain HHB-11173) TaxID=741275 RepID=UPI0004417716|nr:uncharacterized protein PUNSTDRAFT_136887 [Punctularia strigosozonata HHB-11173 SS5]EIN06092.1 hypothetical protein PUNSTDRAFT_136887 [Punctularia strigosozonata HHB-11173 SS5]